MLISSWSNSKLNVFESCPYRAYLTYVLKIPTPPLTAPPGKDEHPLIRGQRVHKAAERYITENVELIPELQSFQDDFEKARDQFRAHPQETFVEQEWAFDRSWNVTNWYSNDAWGRLKLDYGFLQRPEIATVVDFKTGKKYKAKHVDQGQLYGLVTLLRNEKVEEVKVEFWYVDTGEVLERNYTRAQALSFKQGLEDRALALTTATKFPPKPSAWNCGFCPYGEGRDGNKYCGYRFSKDNS